MILKKKILSLCLGIFMCVFCLFSLVSCTLVKVDDEKVNSEEVLKIGNTVLTKADVISGFYTYYQNNSNYFAYYDSETIEESFYQWLIVRQLVSDKSFEALYDKDKNPDGFIYYTKEDADDVWKSVKEYFYSQVSSKEKAIYEADSNYESEEQYPFWLRTADEQTEDSVFEPFKSAITEVDLSKRSEDNLRKKLDEKDVKDMSNQVQDYIFEYVPDANDLDENEEPVRVQIDDSDFIVDARRDAFLKYKADLVANAKDQGKSTDMETCFKDEVYRIYEAYYNSKITTLFQNYYLYEYLTNLDSDGDGVGDGDAITLTDQAVVEAFITQYYTDKQKYSSESQYITALNSEDGATLVLYHFDGAYYYFSIQHILISFNDYLSNAIQALPEYNSSTSNDYQAQIAEVFREERKKLVEEHKNSMLTKVKLKDSKEEAAGEEESKEKVSLFESIEKFGDYYFYDEDLKDCYGEYYIKSEEGSEEVIKLSHDGSGYFYMGGADGSEKQTVDENDVTEVYAGYIKLSDTTYSYDDASNTLTVERTERPNFNNYSKEEVELYATADDILNCYNKTFKFWKAQVSTYLQNDEDTNKELVEKYPDLEYIFNLAKEMTDNGYKEVDIYSKLSDLLFIELEWIYSGDSLGNELSNKIGFVVSTKPDDNGSLVVDFATGAKELMKTLETMMNTESTHENGEGGKYSQLQAIVLGLDEGGVEKLTSSVISQYGIHILKVNDIFECGSSIVNFDESKIDLTENSQFVKDTIALLKKTYVSNASNETLYNFFYEKLYTNNVGTSESGGTYFLAKEYEWLSSLYKDEKIQFTNKMSYDALMESLT